jgi:hypothetical protein
MDNDLKLILEKILTIIGYQNDKSKFIEAFMNLCMQEALAEYVPLLSEERKKELQTILQDQDPNKLREQLRPYIETEEYQKLLLENTQKFLLDYLKTITPELSEEQKNEMSSYFLSFTTDQASVPSQQNA